MDDDSEVWACARCGKPQPKPEPKFCSLKCRFIHWLADWTRDRTPPIQPSEDDDEEPKFEEEEADEPGLGRRRLGKRPRDENDPN